MLLEFLKLLLEVFIKKSHTIHIDIQADTSLDMFYSNLKQVFMVARNICLRNEKFKTNFN